MRIGLNFKRNLQIKSSDPQMNQQKQSLQAMRLQQQNRRLQKAIDQYMEEIEHFKHINAQHQKQIESLLKFNERLLSIIEEQVNNNQNALRQKSLQPISEVTENDSQTMDQMMQLLQKTRNKLAARSQKGGNPYLQHGTSSTIDNNKVYQYMNEAKDLERSQRYVTNDREHSQFGNKSSFSKKRQKKGGQKTDINAKNDFDQEPSLDLQRVRTEARPFQPDNTFNFSFAQQIRKNEEEYKKIEEKVSATVHQEIQEMKKMKYLNERALDDKINRLNNLAKEMTFNPEKKFNELQKKIKLSPHIAAMVQKAMVKK